MSALRSDGGAVRLGCSFAWQKEGAEVLPEVKGMYGKINEIKELPPKNWLKENLISFKPVCVGRYYI